MDFRSRLTFLRLSHHYTMAELAKMAGVSKAAIGNYEAGIRYPKKEQLEAFADIFNVDLDYLTGRSDTPNKYYYENLKTRMDLSSDEVECITKYRSLDDRGRSTVDTVLDHEYSWSQNYGSEDGLVDYLYLGKIAAAGTEIYPGDIPLERIRERRLDGADFMVGVSGDSMEPTYFDGDKVYVKKTTDIEFGDIGLFIVNGCYYIKEFAPDGLRSHNPNYSLIPKSREIIVVGKVLGKVLGKVEK